MNSHLSTARKTCIRRCILVVALLVAAIFAQGAKGRIRARFLSDDVIDYEICLTDLSTQEEFDLLGECATYHPKLMIKHRLLYEAAASRQVQAVKTMVDAGVDVNARYSFGQGALHAAVSRFVQDEAEREKMLEIMQILLDAGADVNAQSPHSGETPLHWAAEDGKKEAVRLLLKRGANRHLKDERGKTALDWATESLDGEQSEVVAILKNKADDFR